MTNDSPSIVNFLLVDDRDANLVALESLLRRDGLNLLKARSGAEALELLLKHDVALALVDVQMPGMDGFELAELMRGSDRTRRIPIVFVTAGHSDQQRRFEGYEKGAVDFLQKPIENDVLKSKASVFFDLYSERQEVTRQRDELEKISRENERLLQESRKYAAALQQADQRKDEFLATLAHELRNPLSPILSGIQLLGMMASDSNEPDENAEIRDMIERQVHHMVRLVDDLLEVSRITSGKINIQNDRVRLVDVIKHAVETSQPNIDAGQHRLILNIPEKELLVNGDVTRLSQVVSNLLNNAARYTPTGGEITVTLDGDANNATIAVKDNGIGIPPSLQSKVFELFTQVNRNQKQSEGGLGIGLALAQRIIELHGGTIDVASDGHDRGSVFTVHLPVLQLFHSTQTLDSVDSGGGPSRSRILVIDDNVDALNCLRLLLVAMGHEVMTAGSGAEGLELFERFAPTYVFLDIGMPVMDGIEVAKRLRKLPGGDSVRLFALTGWGQQEDRERTDAAGFDFHLVKPVTKVAIDQVLTSVNGPQGQQVGR